MPASPHLIAEKIFNAQLDVESPVNKQGAESGSGLGGSRRLSFGGQ